MSKDQRESCQWRRHWSAGRNTARSRQSGSRYCEKSTHNQNHIRTKARFLSESSLLLQTSQCTARSQCLHCAFTVFASRQSEANSLYDTSGTAHTRNNPSMSITDAIELDPYGVRLRGGIRLGSRCRFVRGSENHVKRDTVRGRISVVPHS